jgi:hypothetical protein
MNFLTKVEIFTLLFVSAILEKFALSNEFSTKCPEFNPQNELDIELVKIECESLGCD